MKHINELELPVRDKPKNYILQLEEKGWKEGKEEGKKEGKKEDKEEGLIIAIKGLIRSGSSTEFICNAIEVAEDYVNRIRASMEDE